MSVAEYAFDLSYLMGVLRCQVELHSQVGQGAKASAGHLRWFRRFLAFPFKPRFLTFYQAN